MLITSGRAVGGRPGYFCSTYLLQGTGILFSSKPDQEWKSLRKASHKHLKQYGEGLTLLQNVIQDVQEDMFSQFDEKVGVPFDPKQAAFDAAFGNIAFLLIGVKCKSGDQLLEKMRLYESEALKLIGGATEPKYMIYDVWPWLRFLRMNTWKHIEMIYDLQESIYRDIQNLCKENPKTHNLFKVLIAHVPSYDHSTLGIDEVMDLDIQYSENAVHKTLLSLLLAGVTTTSTTFYALINILAHNPNIQEKLHQEILRLERTSTLDSVNLDDRINMPYCRAVLFETLRYVTILPFGVPHRTVEPVEIDGFHIPTGADIMSNLWSLHHDVDFWKDPFVFRPERFLDDAGQLVQADHPNRKHLLPFGAGPRVCLGESMALARLFIWIATFSQRFTVTPAPGNMTSFTDPRNCRVEGLLRACPYEIVLKKRPIYSKTSKA